MNFREYLINFQKIPLMEVAVGGSVAGEDRRQVALGGDRDILVFSLWQIFPSHGNVGFSWRVEIFWE